MLVQSKSILAKLLAKENIRIEHKKVATAYFDLSARLLVCPIWKDMSPELYDLLMGHEVSHCLHTPPAGWHDAIKQYSGGFKTYLNVIEDVRIERKIKDLYPGLKPSFFAAYEELTAKEFFGPSRLIQSEFLPLIDRINLHFKIGPFANIYFSDEEKVFVDKILKLETWEDVVSISKILFEMGKEEKSKLKQMLDELEEELENMGGSSDNLDDFDDFNSDDFGDDSEKEELEDKISTLKEVLERMSSKDGKDDENEEEDSEESSSITDKIFRNKESDLLDAKSRPYIYGNLPEMKLDAIVVPYKKVIQQDSFSKVTEYLDVSKSEQELESLATAEISQIYKTFMDANKNYISYLIKEFELRRNAKQYARAATAKTGAIDVKKAYTYQYNADIFKRVTTVPKGKNHGLLMFIDFSGSMTDNIRATIEQTIILAIFCRKVNIPYRVFSFSDEPGSHSIYFPTQPLRAGYGNFANSYKFSETIGDLHFDNSSFFLAEYLSSTMNTADFNRAVKLLLGLGSTYYRRMQPPPKIRCNSEAHIMNGTPLVEATAAAIEITKQFKTNYKLDIVNTIFLTDGEGNRTPGIIKNIEEFSYAGSKYKKYTYTDPKPSYTRDPLLDNNLVITDKATGIRGSKKPNERTEVALLDILAKSTGSNVIGFYIMPKPSPNRLIHYVERMGKFMSSNTANEAAKSIKNSKFAAIQMPGYKMQFVLPGESSLDLDDEELEVGKDASVSDYRKAFLKMQKTKQTNRVFLNKFIEQIA